MRSTITAGHLVCLALAGLGLPWIAGAVTIAEINGNKFMSPYAGQSVTNVTGLVTAKGPNGIWIRSTTPDDDPTTSESIYVFSNTVGANLKVGDVISLDGKVTEYRSQANYIYLTEITSPSSVKVISSGNTVTPLVIGKDTSSPPTSEFSSLDGGDIYSLPNGVANISAVNPVLDPTKYGLDFWESLSGELVTVTNPTVVVRANSYRDTWVVGDWAATGRNKNDGITMSDKDSNPEAIIIGSPLDGSKNPTTSKMGDLAESVTGIVQYTFGFYYILPLTALKITSPSSSLATPSTFNSSSNCKALTIGDYNVENLAPNSSHLPKIAAHIVNYLASPDLIFLQEVQDNSGATDDGVVDANITLATLAKSIFDISGGKTNYSYVEVAASAGNLDGGAPGGNIRQAYLYKPEVLSLWKPNQGGASDNTEVSLGEDGKVQLSFNPGRIEPANEAWESSRKPLVAAWRAKGGKKPFFTVNVHFSSKGGGTSLQGDVRPPINGAVAKRVQQAEVTGKLIAEILKLDPAAAVIAAGDFNEFTFVEPMKVFANVSGMRDLDEVAGIPPSERYTYTYDMNAQELDHMYVSPSLASSRKTKYEHLHLNSWANDAGMVSDHDPSVTLVNVCGCA
ncbi:Endonuclease/exonuclease/phosphatase [Naviculisporaceae sp. PSN 640]